MRGREVNEIVICLACLIYWLRNVRQSEVAFPSPFLGLASSVTLLAREARGPGAMRPLRDLPSLTALTRQCAECTLRLGFVYSLLELRFSPSKRRR
ncbi:hypothetical protein E2C01_042118 [Portunus trituberculatus]|uniref:Uncharacterized protein n=1 Tax=Portunus trituberculatus TaxID=210409 RepID=A0A5B7FTQ5_PORTR|nr:hypothetical protein [Portunus trituberculatus]